VAFQSPGALQNPWDVRRLIDSYCTLHIPEPNGVTGFSEIRMPGVYDTFGEYRKNGDESFYDHELTSIFIFGNKHKQYWETVIPKEKTAYIYLSYSNESYGIQLLEK
jgi:hypothetical protein